MDLNEIKSKVENAADVVENAANKVKDALNNLPGMAINKADDGKVSEKLEKEHTATLNNNPRNND